MHAHLVNVVVVVIIAVTCSGFRHPAPPALSFLPSQFSPYQFCNNKVGSLAYLKNRNSTRRTYGAVLRCSSSISPLKVIFAK